MMKTWNTVFTANGQGAAWGIPASRLTTLENDTQAADTILNKVKSGERSAADTVQCSMIFRDMETVARFIKKHYLLTPPLTPSDYPLLLLPLADDTYTPVSVPTGQPSLTITCPGGPHVLLVHLAALAGTEPVGSHGSMGRGGLLFRLSFNFLY
jgi:hypothetical protein